jgi:chlorite dismutase
MTEGIIRQYANFIFYRLDPAWYALEPSAKKESCEEFLKIAEAFKPLMIIKNYSTTGIRADIDFFLWRISETLEPFEEMSTAFRQTLLGQHLQTTHSFLSMTKRSMYVDKHVHEGQESRRTKIVPGDAKYLFIYPFVKTRQWYLLSKEERQRMMDDHIRIGHKYPSVKLNTTYSFGLDDQDFVVAFETDKPADFLDLVMELRETKSSLYTQRDTPIISGIQKTLPEILEGFCAEMAKGSSKGAV